MDGATFQACFEDRTLDNPAASDKTAVNKHIEKLTSTILEFPAASVHKCVRMKCA
jgi:hypothetical protein